MGSYNLLDERACSIMPREMEQCAESLTDGICEQLETFLSTVWQISEFPNLPYDVNICHRYGENI